jgi:hypothetical protein
LIHASASRGSSALEKVGRFIPMNWAYVWPDYAPHDWHQVVALDSSAGLSATASVGSGAAPRFEWPWRPPMASWAVAAVVHCYRTLQTRWESCAWVPPFEMRAFIRHIAIILLRKKWQV